MPTTTAPANPVQQACREMTTPELLADLLSTARRTVRTGEQHAPFITAACSVLQQRCGRSLPSRSFNHEDPAHQLVVQVLTAGGVMAVSAESVREAMMPTLRAQMWAREQAPHDGRTVSTHEEILNGLGTHVFPGPRIPTGRAMTVLYEEDALLGRLLAALAAGEDVDTLVDEITTAAG
ncbi:hypothetical protein [Streptomyces sp. NBC_01439]|uniref:hypothetical protein n=1 Tax=Streptomyces sp. NBC_01439 TaxID=2903867 RepID=UPI002E2C9771|nr:hypothetical protein [Streptomyces sp. NBC_01439]